MCTTFTFKQNFDSENVAYVEKRDKIFSAKLGARKKSYLEQLEGWVLTEFVFSVVPYTVTDRTVGIKDSYLHPKGS